MLLAVSDLNHETKIAPLTTKNALKSLNCSTMQDNEHLENKMGQVSGDQEESAGQPVPKAKPKYKKNSHSSIENKDDFLLKTQCGIVKNERTPRARQTLSEEEEEHNRDDFEINSGARRREGGHSKDRNHRYI